MSNFQFSISKKKTGFSLIELIVVMTIIVVISTVALISYGSTNKKARDGRRSADLQKIAIALEMVRQVGGSYPATTAGLVPAYLPVWPVDPKGYSYVYTPTSYTYTVRAYMEDLGSTNMSPSGSCGTAPGNCNYQIVNP